MMEFIPPDIFSAAVELAPAHRATLNQRKQKAAIYKLRKCSWITPETFGYASNTTVAFVGVILLAFFCRCLLHRWKRYKGIHPVASRCVSRCVAPYRRVAHRIDKVWKRQKRRMKKQFFRLWLLYIILRYLVHRKVARAWTKCKDRGAYYFERMKIAYIRAALFIYRFSSFMRVSAVVIFLRLFMSGDVELHPGPQDRLTIDNLRDVRDEIWDARRDWQDIGIELGLKMIDLDVIEENNPKNIDKCFSKMLTLWLRGVDPLPTWSALVAALKKPAVGLEALAEQVEDKFLRQSRKASDTTDSGQAIGPVPTSGNVVKLDEYAEDLKSDYKFETYATTDDIKWPPPVDKKYKVFRLEIVETNIWRSDFDSDWVRCKKIHEKVDKVVKQRDPIELKDIFDKIEGQRKRVLMEGAPGSGKSTLSFHICREWADGKLFQDYKLVVLIRLRDLSIQEAKTIDELLQKTVGEVADEIKRVKGRNSLFVLDGWDEIRETKPGYSTILHLIRGKELRESSIIITSRPTSSVVLHDLISLRIEILGFSESELESYFTFCLKNDTKAVEDLFKRIKDNPIIKGICYLPLNASILVHLFICEKGKLPVTQYGIFSDLICNCIYRYQKRTRMDATKIKSLKELPQSVDSQFQQLCILAYDGIMKDEVIFHLDPTYPTLDLLQKVESFGRCGGMSYSYNFLHLSIQELLAAIHIAKKLENEEQVEKFKEMYNNPRFSAIFQFYAAITKLETPGIKDVVIQVAKKCAVDRPDRTDKALLLSLLHCLYEAQDSSLCQLVADRLESKFNLGDTTLNLAECFSLQYFLKHLENFDIGLKKCSIGCDKCKALFKPDQAYQFKSLNLEGNPLENEGAHIVSEALKNMKNLQHLNIREISIEDKGLEDILSAVKTMTTLQSLNIGNNDSIKNKGVEAVMETMKKIPNLQHFKLGLEGIGSEAALAILTGMKTMATVPRLNLRRNFRDDDEYATFSEVLKTISNLQYLELRNDYIGNEKVVALSEGLKGLTKLQHLDLQGNKIGEEGGVAICEALRGMANFQYLNLRSTFIGTKAAVALSVAMETMTNLQHLDLGGNYIDDEGAVAISTPLKKMPNLQRLILDSNEFGDRGAEDLAEAMKTMIKLQVLDLGFGGSDNSISHEGAMTILAVIRTMSNLKSLNFYDLPLGDDGAVAVLEAVKVMPSLQQLNVRDDIHNSIGEAGKKAIEEAEELIKTRKSKS